MSSQALSKQNTDIIKTSIDINIHKDPENWEELLDKMKNLKTLGEVLNMFNETFPGIVIGFMNGYSPDYPHLKEDWDKIAKMNNTTTKQVMILDDVSFDENHNLVRHFCECFTRAGFSVRRKMEFIPCKETGLAVPTELLYYCYKSDGRVVPETYSQISSNV